MMRGSIATILDEQDGAKAVFYQVDLEMVDGLGKQRQVLVRTEENRSKVVEEKRTIFWPT